MILLMPEYDSLALAPLPTGYISLATHPALLEYDARISLPFKSRGLKRPEDIALLEFKDQQRLQTSLVKLESEFRMLYQDDAIFRWSRSAIEALTTDRSQHPPRVKLQQLFSRLVNHPEPPISSEGLTLLTWITSRQERWERLMVKLGEPAFAPKGFRLFRGVQDLDATQFIPKVLEAWATQSSLLVRQNALASWSFDIQAAMNFTHDFFKCDCGVIFGADVPFYQVHADKLADGGRFLPWWNQYEAVVGVVTPNTQVVANPLLTMVLFKGKWFSHLDSIKLENAIRNTL